MGIEASSRGAPSNAEWNSPRSLKSRAEPLDTGHVFGAAEIAPENENNPAEAGA